MLTVAVGIATRGRPSILKETLGDLSRQRCAPAAIYVAYVNASDIEDAPLLFPKVRFLQCPGGSCAQRNHLLETIGTSCDLVFFMDDDFCLHPDYLFRIEEAFAADPAIAGATGVVLADGAKGPGLDGDHARDLLRSAAEPPGVRDAPPPAVFNTYGCNMAFRMAAIAGLGLRFDERLPAYGWYEDIDFSRRLLLAGTLVRVHGALGVHLGAKVGRTTGTRLGYSQVVNPVYLARKGSYPWSHAVESIARNMSANLLHSVRPEPYIDRRGRVKGNLLGLWECVRGRCRPERILDML